MSGRFITFEGGEGSGKSTQIKLLATYLENQGEAVVVTREPGGTVGAEAIRALLVTGATDRWDALTELYLLNAARRDHVLRIIEPALERGDTVLCDRFIDSTRVYQGAVKGMADELICDLHEQATDNLWPDLTLLLDLPIEIGLERAQTRAGKENRFETEGLAFHQRLRDGFLALSDIDPERICRIDASGSQEDVAARIRQAVSS
jgi:dTMP kinase